MRSDAFEAMAHLWHVVRHDVRDDDLDVFRSTGRLCVPQAIAVYKNAYWIRQHEVLRELFPLLEDVLGTGKFRELVRRYLRAHPSSHPELEHLGTRLPEFLRAQQDVELSSLAAIAALEQARVESALAADSTLARSRDIEPASFARSRLRMNASLRIIALDDHALRILGPRDFEVVGASHAVVCRPQFSVTTHLIGHDEQRVLAHVLAGATIEQLLERYDHDVAALHRPIERWFRRGWIHAVEVV